MSKKYVYKECAECGRYGEIREDSDECDSCLRGSGLSKKFVVVWYDSFGKKEDLKSFDDFYEAREWAWKHPLISCRVEERQDSL